MPISFIPYQQDYQEQIKILAALLQGELKSPEGATPQAPFSFPLLTGTFRQREVEIRVVQETTQAGANPLCTDKYLYISMGCSSTLELKIGPKTWLSKLGKLIWWRHIFLGKKSFDRKYSIISPQRLRSQRLLSRKRINNLLLQLGPFHTLQLVGGYLSVRYLITSHQVFMARNLAGLLHQLARLARLAENVA